jgi:hypothetical protein
MKLGNGILKTSIQELSDGNFHFYNSLVLTDDLARQRTPFRINHPTFHVSTSMTLYPIAQMICPYKINQHRKTLSFLK